MLHAVARSLRHGESAEATLLEAMPCRREDQRAHRTDHERRESRDTGVLRGAGLGPHPRILAAASRALAATEARESSHIVT
jgi:hypothetical protein